MQLVLMSVVAVEQTVVPVGNYICQITLDYCPIIMLQSTPVVTIFTNIYFQLEIASF